MSLVKISSIEASRISESGNNGARMDSSDLIGSEINWFDSLPDEMLFKVFSYLGHGDKIDSRLVCARWCQVITSWGGLKSSLVYTLKRHTDAFKTWEKSQHHFSLIRIQLDGHKTIRGQIIIDRNETLKFDRWVRRLVVPNVVAEKVKTLQLRADFSSFYSWKSLQRLILKFPNLIALDIEADIIDANSTRKSSPESQAEDLILKQNWEAIVKNLQILRIYGVTTLADLAKSLSSFAEVRNLVELKVGYIAPDSEDSDNDNVQADYEATMNHLCHMVLASQETIKKLTVISDFVNSQYLKIILAPRNLVSLDLEFRCDLQLLKRCLGALEKLKHISFPTIFDSDDDDLNTSAQLLLIAALPRTVRSLKLKRACRIQSDFLDKLPELAHLKLLYSQIVPYVKTGKKYVKMRQLRCLLPDTTSLDWVSAFPNLTKLHLEPKPWRDTNFVNDLTLQAIIKNMKMLKSLKLEGSYNTISDYGVTGIRRNYHVIHLCNFLIETKILSEDGSEEDSSEYRTGLPLCSLKGLNELIIDTQGDISNFGFRFGFGLKELRSLSLNLYDQPNRQDDNPRPRLTDAAMRFLGMENPNLEYLHLNFQCKNNVTHIGLSQLQSQLRRIKAENHNLEYLKSKLYISV